MWLVSLAVAAVAVGCVLHTQQGAAGGVAGDRRAQWELAFSCWDLRPIPALSPVHVYFPRETRVVVLEV